MSSSLLRRRDLEFLLYEWLAVEDLVKRTRFSDHSRETFDAVLDLAERVATEQFAPHNKAGDRCEPQLRDGRAVLLPEVKTALDVFATTGLLASAMDQRVDGLQLPTVVARACFAYLQAANVSTANYPFLTTANANLLLEHGSAEQVETYVRPMVAGRFFGTMCLSEPEAGSSLADVSTSAVPQPDGSYRMFGTKMWISGGDHELAANIVHLVLARTPAAPSGVRGLSLFIVPKTVVETGERNDVVLVGLNHKMGSRGTTNTVLSFGEGRYTPGGAAGAVGFLVGEVGSGLQYMFHMMNEARIGVGSAAMALGYTGYLKSLRYANERVQGRPLANKDPAQPQVSLIEHPDVRRMLLAQKAYVEGALALVLYSDRLLDEQKTAGTRAERARAGLLLDVLTPITKSWPSQWCLAANDLAIQIHGGYGYTREFDVEQHYRDNRLNSIHEGTHGIQALDLLGRKVRLQDGAGLRLLAGTMLSTADRATAELAPYAEDLCAAVDRTLTTTDALWAAGDAELALANASIYLEAFGHVVIAWLWLEQLLVAEGHRGDFYDGKRAAATYFFRYELPKTRAQFDLLTSLDRTTLDARAGWF